jgi:hypothetical protein
MKRLVKRVLKAVWRSTEGLRRPILSRVERFLRHCLQPIDSSQLTETDVLMDHVVRELVRLQREVEALQHTILEHFGAEEDRPTIAGEIEPAGGGDERLKAG